MKKFLTPMTIFISCIPLGIIVSLVGIRMEIDFLSNIGNIIAITGLVVFLVYQHKRMSTLQRKSSNTQAIEQQVSLLARLWTYTILAISFVSLPLIMYVVFAHPEGTDKDIPISYIVIPVGMTGVGIERLFQSRVLRRVLRWLALILLTIAIVGFGATWYVKIHLLEQGFGIYSPKNIFVVIFLVLLFLYGSKSKKVQRSTSTDSIVWFGFSLALFLLCTLSIVAVKALLQH